MLFNGFSQLLRHNFGPFRKRVFVQNLILAQSNAKRLWIKRNSSCRTAGERYRSGLIFDFTSHSAQKPKEAKEKNVLTVSYLAPKTYISFSMRLDVILWSYHRATTHLKWAAIGGRDPKIVHSLVLSKRLALGGKASPLRVRSASFMAHSDNLAPLLIVTRHAI